MVFAKQYSRKAQGGLSIAPAANKFEVGTKTSARIWEKLLGIQELFTHQLAPTLTTRDLLRLSATCKVCIHTRGPVVPSRPVPSASLTLAYRTHHHHTKTQPTNTQELAVARAFVTEVVVRRDLRRSAVPRAVRLGLPVLPGLRVLGTCRAYTRALRRGKWAVSYTHLRAHET